MKKAYLFLILVVLSVISFGQEFIGIKVEGKLNEVVEKFKQKGLKVTASSIPNIVAMKGIVANKKIELNIVCTPKTKNVWKFAVYLPKQTNWSNLKLEYEEYLELLSKKYGEPETKYNFFSAPYEEGDNNELIAVSLEKCVFSAFWLKNKSLSLEISKWSQVRISYENETNFELSKKEEEEIKNEIF